MNRIFLNFFCHFFMVLGLLTGTANTYELGATYPLRRIEAQTIQLALNYAHKEMEDVVDSGGGVSMVTPKRSNAITVGLNVRDQRTLAGFDGVTQANVSVTAGDLSISGDALATDQAAGGPCVRCD